LTDLRNISSHLFRQAPRSCLCLALAILVLGSLGCQSMSGMGGGSADGAAGKRAGSEFGRLPAILERGQLRVGISGDLPPLNMTNKSGEIIGLEVDIVTALANAMGLDVELVAVPFPDLIGALLDGRVDLVISGMTMTPERNARVAFVGPYFISGTSVVTKDEDIASEQEPANLDVPGRKYAALAESTSALFVEEVLPQTTLITTENYDEAVKMVINGEIDGLVADFQVCILSTWRNPEAGLMAIRTPFTVEPLGIALPPDAPLLLNLVSNYLNTLEDTGLLAQLKAKWLSDGSWLSELP
jgi:polar amino acid transport system substrate-binding protein